MESKIIDAEKLKQKGNELMQKKEYKLAVDMYTQSIKVDSKDCRTFSDRAQAYIQCQEYQKALDDANIAIRLDPTYMNGYYRRANANTKLNKSQEAIKDFNYILQNDPGNEEVQFEVIRLMELLMKKNQPNLSYPQNKEDQSLLEMIDQYNYESCFICNAPPNQARPCSYCQSVYYCSEKCQQIDYPVHFRACKESSKFSQFSFDPSIFYQLNTLQRKCKSAEEYRELLLRRAQIIDEFELESRQANKYIANLTGGVQRVKPDTVIDKSTKELKLIFLSELEIDQVNQGKFILVRALKDARMKQSIMNIVEDVSKVATRVGIYNANYNYVSKDQWFIVKEPFYKTANDGLNLIRVDKPSDVQFLQFAKDADSQYLNSIIKSVNTVAYEFEIALLFPSKIEKGQEIYFYGEGKWHKAQAYSSSNLLKNIFGETLICEHYLSITLKQEEQSEIFLVALKKLFTLNSGISIKFWVPRVISYQQLFIEKLIENTFPPDLVQNMKFLLEQVDTTKNVRNEIDKIWIANLDMIKELQYDYLLYKSGDQNKKSSKARKRKKEGPNSQLLKDIEFIEEALIKYLANPSLAFEELFLEQEMISKNNAFIGYSISVDKKKMQKAPPIQSIVENKSSVMNCSKIVKQLVSLGDANILGLCLEVLSYRKVLLQSGQNTNDEISFAKACFKKFVSKSKIKQELLETALTLLDVEFSLNDFGQIAQSIKEAKALKKKKVKKGKKVNIESISQISIINSSEEIQEIEQEFPEASSVHISEDEEESNEKQEELKEHESDLLSKTSKTSSHQTVLSFLTVHSRAQFQYQNNHWKDRYLERNVNVEEKDWNTILEQLKKQLKNGQNVFRSQKASDRVMVVSPEGLKFILVSKGKENKKELFIPVTVLAPYMKFN